MKLIWERIAGDFSPHFIAERRGTLSGRLGFEMSRQLGPQEPFSAGL